MIKKSGGWNKMTTEYNLKCPKCNSTDVYVEDSSFDHEFGKEIIKFPVCNECEYGLGDNDDIEFESWENKIK